LWRYLNPEYFGKQLKRFEPLLTELPDDMLLSRRNRFRAEMLQEVSAQLERASAILPSISCAPHGADESCDLCSQQQAAVKQEVSSLESDSSVELVHCVSDSQASSNTKPRQQTGHSEERKRQEDIESLWVPPHTMVALPMKRDPLDDPEEMWEAFLSGSPLPEFPGGIDKYVFNQSRPRVNSHETHQVPERNPDPSINSPRMSRHLRDLFAKAKDVAQQLETTVQTMPTSVRNVSWIKYTMENLVQPNLDALGPLLIPISDIKPSPKSPHSQ
jgi:hypothetical protein